MSLARRAMNWKEMYHKSYLDNYRCDEFDNSAINPESIGKEVNYRRFERKIDKFG